MPKISAPTLLHLALQDPLCPSDAQHAIKTAAASNAKLQISEYADVGQAFARRGSQVFRKEAAERADGVTLKFVRALEPLAQT